MQLHALAGTADEEIDMTSRSNIKVLNWINRLDPYPDESLASFLSRWARENVLLSRLNLLRELGISRGIHIPAMRLRTLASALKIDLSVVLSMAPSFTPRVPALRQYFVNPSTEGICPTCLEVSSYSRQLWSNRLAVACPVHGTRLQDKCQSCGNGIRHDRPLAHICDCGSDLRRQHVEKASTAEVELANLLIGVKPSDARFPFNFDNGVPPDIDLFVFNLIRFLSEGKVEIHLRNGGLAPLPKDVSEAVETLAPMLNLLDNWPHNFNRRIKELIDCASTASTGAASKYRRWYFFLFRKHSHSAYDPLRVMAANQLVLAHQGVLNSRTHCVKTFATVEKYWFSIAEVAVKLHIVAERLNEGIDRKLIDARVHDVSAGYRQRFVSKGEVDRLLEVQFDYINDTIAIKLLQVPEAVYMILRESSWITRSDIRTLAPVVSGDIQRGSLVALIHRLLSNTPLKRDSENVPFVLLKNLNLRLTTDRQRLINLFRAIALGELKPIGQDGSLTIGGLMFSEAEVERRICSKYVARCLTLEQVAFLTNAHYDAVKAWIDIGILPARKEPLALGKPWVIELHDLVTFLQTYIPLAFQARALKSRSRSLVSSLQRVGVTAIKPDGGRGALLRIPDLLAVAQCSNSAISCGEDDRFGSRPPDADDHRTNPAN